MTPLPCPFCHSQDVSAEQAARGHGKSIDVECQGCGARLVGVDAVSRWNQALRQPTSEARVAPAVELKPEGVTMPGDYWMRTRSKGWHHVKVTQSAHETGFRAWVEGKPVRVEKMHPTTRFVGMEKPQ